MTLLSEAQLEAQIPSVVGVIYPGMYESKNRQLTGNHRYFAYATIVAVYVYHIESFKLANVIALQQSFSTLSLATNDSNFLAIACKGLFQIVDVLSNQEILRIEPSPPVVSIGWCRNNDNIICFTKFFREAYFYGIRSGSQSSVRFGSFENIRTIAVSMQEPPVFIGGNNNGTVTLVQTDLTGKSKDFVDRGPVVASEIDPHGSNMCLIVWEKGSWALFDVQSFNVVKETTGLNLNFSTAVWSSVPGRFFTGDQWSGTIRCWNVTCDSASDFVTIHSLGILRLQNLGQNLLLCGMKDGSVMVYDIAKRMRLFSTTAGHNNTIFAVRFLPFSQSMFASAGAEGMLCFWDASAKVQKDRISLPEGLGVLYSMEISPDGKLAACGFVVGDLALVNLETRSISQIKVTTGRIICLSFNMEDTKELLCVSDEHFAGIVDINRQQVVWEVPRTYQVISGRFSRTAKIAFGCKNGHILIWKNQTLMQDFALDSAPIYGIGWPPFDDSLLVTADDQGKITKCNLRSSALTVIGLHESAGRPVVFHPTVSNIIASGSVGGYVMIHDSKSDSVLCVFRAHSAPIYSLAFSPENPLLLITAGSDCCIKFWSLDSVFSSLAIDGIIGNDTRWIRPLDGYRQIIKLCKRMSETGDSQSFEQNDMFHMKDIETHLRIENRDLTNTSKPLLRRAAAVELYAGHTQRYCELLFAAGDLDAAVMAAPAVSYEFWLHLMSMKSELESFNEAANSMVTCGRIEEAIDLLLRMGNGREGFMLAAANSAHLFDVTVKELRTETIRHDYSYIETDFSRPELYLPFITASKRANFHIEKGEPYLAACAYLSIGDVASAEMLLIRYGQISTALLVDNILKTGNAIVREKAALLAIELGKVEEGLSMLDTKERSRVVLAVGTNDITSLYAKCGLKPPESYDVVSKSSDEVENLHMMLLSGRITSAVEFFLEYAKQNVHTNFATVKSMTDLISLVNVSAMSEALSLQIACILLYVAAYEALWKGYVPIFKRIVERIEDLLTKTPCKWFDIYAAEVKRAFEIFGLKYSNRLYPVGHSFLNEKPLGKPYSLSEKYGTRYVLEDGLTCLSMEEALMWFDVTSMSPISFFVRHYVL